jgi:hypothetical protein
MQKQFYMKISKSNYSLLLIILINSSCLCGQNKPEFDIERARTDVIASQDDSVPVENIQKGNYSIIFLNDLCVVHFPYRDLFTESIMKSSIIAIYKYSRDQWSLVNIAPYYYTISLVDEKNQVFLSENELCYPSGLCNSYVEINQLNSNYEFAPIFEKSGFNKYLNVWRLLTLNRKSEIDVKANDTITKIIHLKNINIKNARINFTEEIDLSFFKETLGDSIFTKDIKKVVKKEFRLISK